LGGSGVGWSVPSIDVADALLDERRANLHDFPM
jgi:hypothetical protein